VSRGAWISSNRLLRSYLWKPRLQTRRVEPKLVRLLAAQPCKSACIRLTSFSPPCIPPCRLPFCLQIIGTNGYCDETSYQLAAKRGIFIAQHHISPLGETASSRL